jgi:DNA-binding GntR family transcriptional regulator
VACAKGIGVTSVSLTEEAYGAIKAAILDGKIAPNSPIDEKSTAARLGMSRTPVREALLRLRNEGLVDMTRGRGIHVRLLSSIDMREIYELITGVETLAAYLIASRKPGEAELAPLLAAVAEMEAAGHVSSVEAWGQADEAFHRALLTLCGNSRARALGLQLRDTIQRPHLVAMRLQAPDYLNGSATAHRALATLILKHEAEQAANMHFRQRRRGEEALMQVVERYRLAVL